MLLWKLAGAAFLVGLLGGVHCAGMCGGFASAFARAGAPGFAGWKLQVGLSAGRLASYAFAGAVAGSLAGTAMLARDVLPVQFGLYLFANVLLIGLGLYLAGWTAFVTRLEAPGRWLWARLSRFTRTFLPIDGWGRAFGAGAVWGWVPCGLVYTMLATAMLAGSPAGAAAVMLAFGAGTLPAVLGAGMALRWLGLRSQRSGTIRVAAGGLVAGFGLIGLAQAGSLASALRQGIACLV